MSENSHRTDRDVHDLEQVLHRRLIEDLEIELETGGIHEFPGPSALAARLAQMVQSEPVILTEQQRDELVRGIVDRTLGLGPLEPLLADATISEIMVNDPANIFVERAGRIERTEVQFHSEEDLRHVIERIVAPLGRRVDESSPLVDARLPDGSRVNVIIPPLAIRGPAVTIRKFSLQPFSMDRLVTLGTIDSSMAAFLQRSVRSRMSILISGGTGSGKTSTLNALGRCIPTHERLITIEDAAEMQLQHPHLISLESRPANIEDQGEVTIRTLVRNALRMRPDRIIVGEVRGGEAFDMLQAMNTGHRGSLTTLHANSSEDALIRLESMVLMAGYEMPVAAIQRMISGAIELIVHQDRLADGRRVVTAITGVEQGPEREPHFVPLFSYDAKLGQHVQSTPLKSVQQRPANPEEVCS
jgi:pilus assembly protein CpaF